MGLLNTGRLKSKAWETAVHTAKETGSCSRAGAGAGTLGHKTIIRGASQPLTRLLCRFLLVTHSDGGGRRHPLILSSIEARPMAHDNGPKQETARNR